MSSENKFLSTALCLVVVLGLAQVSFADPLIITVARTNSSFTPLASTTLDTAILPPGSQNNATLSPGLITFYNTAFGAGLTNPFAGTGVNWVVSGQVNVPGDPSEGLLQGGTILLHNSTATTYYAAITIEGGNFSLPGSMGDQVLATASFSSAALQDGSAWLYSFIDNNPIGSVWYNSPANGPDQSILYVRGSTYRLKEIFYITLNGNPTNDPNSNVNISVTTTVTPVSEPWNVATLFAMVIPTGLLFAYFRRRKLAGSPAVG